MIGEKIKDQKLSHFNVDFLINKIFFLNKNLTNHNNIAMTHKI